MATIVYLPIRKWVHFLTIFRLIDSALHRLKQHKYIFLLSMMASRNRLGLAGGCHFPERIQLGTKLVMYLIESMGPDSYSRLN